MSSTVGFTCPVCGGELRESEHAVSCQNGHSFDKARQGYVNLLLPNHMHSKLPGDTKEMTDSRRRFLDGGYYDCFKKKLCKLIKDLTADIESPVILDVGCGEGYYTGAMADAVPDGKVFGLDISKAAVKAAAGRYKNVSFAVASSFSLPVPDGFCHVLTNVFSPLAEEEFARAVKYNGYFVYAVPGERHLFGMKEILYDEPYENERKDTEYAGFDFIARHEVRDVITVPDSTTAQDLFAMTPYYWKTGVDGGKRLREAGAFLTEIAFDFLVYRRKEE